MTTLKDLREQKNLSFAVMARLLNISKSYYWQLENNKRRLYYDTAIKIAEVFNLKPDELFYNDFQGKKKITS